MKDKILYSFCFLILSYSLKSQNSINYSGQIISTLNYSPQNENKLLAGIRYLPSLNLKKSLDSTEKQFDAEIALNIHYSTYLQPKLDEIGKGIQPYRLYARYKTNQLELRAGLQKIDFGSALLLRPLQWFNQIDPRDPLQLTTGVYGILGRYYFLNNANIWVWGLYGNKERRGLDFNSSNEKIPEFGGRVQYPVTKGEIAFSYHHRNIIEPTLSITFLNENRFALDGKWDLGVGLWTETSYIQKSKERFWGNQFLQTIGIDYTFGIGNGLNIVTENLFLKIFNTTFTEGVSRAISAFSVNYPISMYDRISSYAISSWSKNSTMYMLNYEHSFVHLKGYLMAYYNPKTQLTFIQNSLSTQFEGPGARIMLVYNH